MRISHNLDFSFCRFFYCSFSSFFSPFLFSFLFTLHIFLSGRKKKKSLVNPEKGTLINYRCVGLFMHRSCHKVDYSTDVFLQVMRRLASIMDWPKKVCSDCGTQLMVSSKELKEAIKELDYTNYRSIAYNTNLNSCLPRAMHIG